MTGLEPLLYGFAFLYGIVLGSFLNVVIYRVPLGISVAKGRSYCPSCEHPLQGMDLIPVVSFLMLGRKCRYCGKGISWRYPLIELCGGLIGVYAVFKFGFTIQAVGFFALGLVLLAVTMIDYDTMTIPDGLLIAFGVVAIGLMIWGEPLPWLDRIMGVFSVALPMYLALYLVEDCFGGGDIKLMGIAGFLLGWKLNLLATFIGVVGGGLVGAILLSKQKAKGQVHMAFGPYLCIGILLSYLYGEQLLNWYFSLF